MNEDNREVESIQNQDVHNNFAAKRVQEIMDNKQGTFGRPDLDHLEPVMEDLLAGNYRDLHISYVAKDGIKVDVNLKGFG